MAVKASNSITVYDQTDVLKVTTFYQRVSSTANPPTKPNTTTTNAAVSGWSTTMPAYGSSYRCYKVERSERGDGTCVWGTVTEDQAWAGANTANSTAADATSVAQAAQAATQPIASATYTGLIGSANDAANASFYFAKVHPAVYTAQWRVKLEIRVTAPVGYTQRVIAEVCGDNSNFRSYNSLVSRDTSLGMCYLNLYRATKAGINTNHKGHALGFGLRASTNPTTASAARTIEVDVLEADGCTVDLLATAVKYNALDGTGSTNYAGLTEMGVGTNGQNATNNTNTNNVDRFQYGVALAALEAIAVGRIAVLDSATKKLRILNDTTPFDASCPPLYVNVAYSADNVNKAATRVTNFAAWGTAFNLTNTHAVAGAAAHKAVYIVGTLSGTTFTPTSTVFTCTVPTSEDNLHYMRLGIMSTAANAVLEGEHPVYAFFGGAFQRVDLAAKKLADDAAKTATNVIQQRNGEGLIVGDFTADVMGKNSLLDSDGLHVREGDGVNAAELAFFGADRVKLGEQSPTSVIEMCGDSLEISTENLALSGDRNATLAIIKSTGDSGDHIGSLQMFSLDSQCSSAISAKSTSDTSLESRVGCSTSGTTVASSIRASSNPNSSTGYVSSMSLSSGSETTVGTWIATAAQSGSSHSTRVKTYASLTESYYNVESDSVAIVASKSTLKTTGRSTSWKDGMHGEATVYVDKGTTNQWSPVFVTKTKGGGAWACGNYDNENLLFTYMTPEDYSGNTNASTHYLQLRPGFQVISWQNLYYNTTGTQGTVTLKHGGNDVSAANYNYMIIVFAQANTGTGNANGPYNSVMVNVPNGKYVDLSTIYNSNTATTIQHAYATVLISGSTITFKKTGRINVDTYGNANASNSEARIYIHSVFGGVW